MKLIIVRHGETVENVSDVLMGATGGNLSKKGILQAQGLAKLLAKDQFDAIYSSDLERCKDTAKEIGKYQRVTVNYTEELRERSFGKLENQKFVPNWDLMDGDSGYQKTNGIESLEHLIKRAEGFLRKIKKEHPEGKVLVVTHGGMIRAINSVLTGRPLEELYKTTKVGNAGICEYTVSRGRAIENRYNDLRHL